MLHDFFLFLPIPTLLKLPSPALVSLLIPPLTLRAPILLGFHTRVCPHFSVSKIRRGGSKFQCKILKVDEWNSCLHFACISFDFFTSLHWTRENNFARQSKFFWKILPHWLIIVLVWSNISHFQNSTVFRFIVKFSHKVFQAY